MLLGCGLRRGELVKLTVGHFQQRESRWVIVDLIGKGNRPRMVPVPAWVKNAVDRWLAASAIQDGSIFRSVKKERKAESSPAPAVPRALSPLSENGIWWLVRQYAEEMGVSNLAPHDLRRTTAKLCRKAGGDLEQIQMLLGHRSIQTTEKYLGMQQNLVEAVNDKLGIVHADE